MKTMAAVLHGPGTDWELTELELYRAGDVKLDELITRRYRLEEIDQGYRDMLDGKNIRGLIVHEHQ